MQETSDNVEQFFNSQLLHTFWYVSYCVRCDVHTLGRRRSLVRKGQHL